MTKVFASLKHMFHIVAGHHLPSGNHITKENGFFKILTQFNAILIKYTISPILFF